MIVTAQQVPAVPAPGAQHAARSFDVWIRAAALLAVFMVATLLAWARMPVSTRSVVWAEDGSLFLSERASLGVLASLLHPYAGYLHLWPRIIAALASSWTDLTHYAELLSFGACVLVGAVATLVFFCSRTVTPWLPARLAFAAITVLLPAAPVEVLGNVANVHAYLLWGTIWMLLYAPKTVRGAVVLGLIALTFSLSEIQIVLLLPLFAYGLRSKTRWIVRAGVGIGLIGQAVATLATPRTVVPGNPPLASYVQGYLLDVTTSNFFPSDQALASFVADTGWWVGIFFFIPFAAALAYTLWRGTVVMRVTAGGLFYVSVAAWVFAYRQVPAVFWYSTYTHQQMLALTSIRYAIVPSMCLLALPPLAAAALYRRCSLKAGSAGELRNERPTPRIIATVIPVALICVLLAAFTPPYTEKMNQPDWPAAVAAARESCTAAADQGSIRILTAPAGLTPPWGPKLTCAFVAAH